jgi:hypothetical protein
VTTLIDRYVKVVGQPMPEQAYQTAMPLGPITLRGSRFVPLQVAGTRDPVFVLDEGRIPQRDAIGHVTVIGRLTAGTGQQPSYYVEIETPINIVLNNNIARVGIMGLVALLGLMLLGWWVRAAHYALGVAGAGGGRAAAGYWWFGGLGPGWGNAVVRNVRVEPDQTTQGLQFAAAAGGEPWQVQVRQAQRIKAVHAATPAGALPALRLTFIDERGLTRHGTLAMGNAVDRNTLMQTLQELKARL